MALLHRARRLSRRLPPTWDRRLRELAKMLLDYRGARASFLRASLFVFMGRYSRLLLAPFGRGELLVDTADNEVGRAVFITGGYERIYMESALRYLTAFEPEWRKGTTFVDIGANIGTSTVDALLEFGFERAICFEPDARSLRLLKANLVLNELDDRVTLHPVALSDRDGEALLECSASNFGDNRLSTSASVSGAEGLVRRVACTRLDSIVARGDLATDQVGLVWIDVQGHEPFVLVGAMTIVRAGLPTVVEYAPSALRSSGGLELLENLVGRHYTTVVDLRWLAHGVTSSAILEASSVRRLRERYDEAEQTDLLLLR